MGLLPREHSFFDDFEQHGKETVAGCRAFLALAANMDGAADAARAIKDHEHKCDTITHSVVEKLHKVFITPIDRNDIYRLITRMDDIMDYVEAAAERLALYEITKSTKGLGELAQTLVTQSEGVLDALTKMRNMKNPKAIIDCCVEINRLENVADSQLRASLSTLFKEERDPITVIKWKEIYELLETATDRCEDVANIIEGVVLENS